MRDLPSKLRLTRRRLLELSAAGTATIALARGLTACSDGDRVAPPEPEPNDGAVLTTLDPSAAPDDEALFPLGVQAGVLTSTSALLWTFATESAPLQLRVWRDATTPGQVKLVKTLEATPVDGYVKVPVEGLGPGWYRFAFYDAALARRGPIGRFRTAFGADDLRPLTLAGLSCTNEKRRPYVALDAAAEDAPDLICHLGDMSYNDDAVTLEDYRAKWKGSLGDPGYRHLYSVAGLVATWDDHEIANNFDPEEMAAEHPEQLAAAKNAYFETVAVERGPNDRLWRSHRWGKTAELFVLDCRTERLPSTRGTDQAVYISPEQMAWLKQGLVDSPCRYKIVFNSVPITTFPSLWAAADKDRWTGYASQRKELVDHLVARAIDGVWFLTGDFHCAFVGRIEPEGPASKYLEIAVGPTAPNSPNPFAILADANLVPREDAFPARQFLFGSGTNQATTKLTFDPLNERVSIRIVDQRPTTRGQVLYDAVLPG